jgi:hypothetical protein
MTRAASCGTPFGVQVRVVPLTVDYEFDGGATSQDEIVCL